MSTKSQTPLRMEAYLRTHDTDGERQATITVTYTYNGTETASDAITVSQQPGEEPVPTITITTEDPLTLAADGGSYTIEYEITDPTEDGSISADAPVGLQTSTAIQKGS